MTEPGGQTPLRTRVDGTMSLLTDLMDDAVHSDYGEPGERPQQSPREHRAWLPWTLGALALAGIILAAAMAQTRADSSQDQAERDALVARVRAADGANAALDERIRTLRADVAAAEARAVADSEEGQALAEQADRLAVQAQYTTVTGSGAVVQLDDSERPSRGQVDLGQVLDRDLQMVVNGLWQAGATSVAVNDHRLSSRTAIRSAGGAILVDYHPLTRPYRVAAIGPESMAAQFEDGPAGRDLTSLADDYGVRWSLQPVDDLTLPPAESALPQFATPAGGAP